MTVFEKFVDDLDKLPKIDTNFVWAGDNVIQNGDVQLESFVVRVGGETLEEVQTALMSQISEAIGSKRAWVRAMPYIRAVGDQFSGIARIAVMPE